MQEQEAAAAPAGAAAAAPAAEAPVPAPPPPPQRKTKKKKRKQQEAKGDDAASGGGGGRKKPRSKGGRSGGGRSSAAEAAAAAAAQQQAQQAVNEQMLRALEEDQYSAAGSILDTESDEEDSYMYRGKPVRLDRSAIQQAIKKMAHLERMGAATAASAMMTSSSSNAAISSHEGDKEQEDANSGLAGRGGNNKKKQKKKDEHSSAAGGGGGALLDEHGVAPGGGAGSGGKTTDDFSDTEEDLDRDGGSIFGATTGASNSTWVECDKCKKWRRLRGVVDEKKLPTKWYCSMNKNDPERARCSAPEEEYDTQQTPESAADARTRKHLRVWVRRLQCNEAYEASLPTLTRGKKRATASSSKDPYEWVRCCNPSCGKWRAVLRCQDAKSSVIDRTKDGEWYCVMNTWDEKTASCAAPQENLPAVGCPPWIMQDDE